MFVKKYHSLLLLLFLILAITLSGCDALIATQPANATPESQTGPEAAATTQVPQPPTDTPVPPTPTFTETPPPTLPPTRTPPPTRTSPPTNTATLIATATLADPIIVYYFNLNQNGPFGCGEALWWVRTQQEKTDNIDHDITYALQRLFSYHGEYFGELYNPYGASNFAVGHIETIDRNEFSVYLTGTYVKSKDSCDATRLRDQIKQTILQFDIVRYAHIYLNGSTLGDALSRK